MNYQVKEGQNIFDVCLQNFGTLENLFDLLSVNNINVNSNLSSGQILVINNESVGNELIKSTIIKENLVFVNEQLKNDDLQGGDYNNDHNQDYY